MRIVQIITRLNVGGPARHVLLTSELFAPLGCTSLVVHGLEEPGEGSLADAVGGQGFRAIQVAALRRPVRPWSDVRALVRLVQLLFRERPDVVHTHTAKAGTLGRLAATFYNLTQPRSRRCVIVHTFHGHVFSGYFSATGSALVRGIERALASLTDRIIAVSVRQRQELVERYRIAPEPKFETIEIGSDLDPLLRLGANTSLRERFDFGNEHVVFGYAGRFAPIKALPVLIQAFRQTLQRLPHARLLLIGDGGERPAIERDVARLGLGGRVAFAGWIRDVKAIYGAMDVCVLSSRNEGTPLALLEAMAAGRPVVATAVGGVADLVSHGRNGLLVPAGDVAAMAGAMTELGTDEGRRREMGATARRDVASRVDADQIATRILDVYARACIVRRAPVQSRVAAS